jgi:hypothetical protein
MNVISAQQTAWRFLVGSGIIPNTSCALVLLSLHQGFVQRSVALHLAIRN